MSFQQGLSGLNTASQALDIIGNNVANSSTVGFKSSNAHFSDVYAASMTGGSAVQVGIGTSMSTVAQQFTQGNITTTNNPLDISINGTGFFRMSNNGSITYTRNGQFHLDKNGYIVNDAGLHVTGYMAASDGTIYKQTPTDLQIGPSLLKLSPVATGASTGSSYAGVQAAVQLDSRANVDPATYNYTTGVDVYDSLGNSHRMTYYFQKTATAGTWNMYASVDGTLMDGTGDTPNLTTPTVVTFDTLGQLSTINGTAVPPNPAAVAGTKPEIPVSIDLAKVASNLGRSDWGAKSPLTFKINLAGTTQYGATSATNQMLQDGYTSGNLSGLSVDASGVVQGRYSNGQTKNVGQLVLASFQNPNGLANIGGNQWVETSQSGQPTVDSPGSGQLGAVQSNAQEDSNVDLTGELVKMITQQRNYQASAQTIKTQDSVMNTIVNLR